MNGLEKEHGHTHVGLYVQAMAKWLAVALVTGVCCGVVGSLFHIGVERATELREQHPWLLWCLPAAGLVIVAFYKLTKTEGQGTNDIIDAVHHGKPLSIWLLPAIFLGTILTHLCGGSAGREGAALQMGGTIGRHAGSLFNLDDRDLRTATMAGMAAFFSALFGTPLTATVFAIVVISIGVVYHVAFIPCLTASLVAYWISVELGVAPTRFSVAAPELEKLMLLRVAVLGGRLRPGVRSAVPDPALRGASDEEAPAQRLAPRALSGGGAVIALTYLCGTRDYNGAGMDRHHRRRGAGHCPAGGVSAEDPVHRRDALRRVQGRRGGALLLRGGHLRLCGGAAAGDPGGLRRGAGAGGGVLRGHQLPAGLHLPVRGAVRGWWACCTLPWSAASATCSPATMGCTPARPSSTPS